MKSDPAQYEKGSRDVVGIQDVQQNIGITNYPRLDRMPLANGWHRWDIEKMKPVLNVHSQQIRIGSYVRWCFHWISFELLTREA